MISANYGAMHQPKIVRNILGLITDRTNLRMVPKDSAAVYLGSFVSDMIDDNTNLTAVQYGDVQVYAATSNLILGFVTSIGKNGNVPIQDEPKAAGVITNATGELPMKYTFAAANDRHNATPVLEFVEVTPIWAGDILEVALWGASTVSVARGTTTGSDKVGASFPINTTYPFALTEASLVAQNATVTGVQFVETLLDGQQPANPNHVYVKCIRASANVFNRV